MDVPDSEILRCFKHNKLDELIHTKYSIPVNSKYYKDFCEKHIVIGKTYFNLEEKGIDTIELSEGLEITPKIYTTIQPSYHYQSPSDTSTLAEESIKELQAIILDKITAYKQQDIIKGRPITKDYVTVDDVLRLLQKQEHKCYVCCDFVITEEWYKGCLYQFTLDRVDNKLPHTKNNVLIACYYCNCFGHLNTADDVCLHKLCNSKCHSNLKRPKPRTRYEVPKEEIIKLLL